MRRKQTRMVFSANGMKRSFAECLQSAAHDSKDLRLCRLPCGKPPAFRGAYINDRGSASVLLVADLKSLRHFVRLEAEPQSCFVSGRKAGGFPHGGGKAANQLPRGLRPRCYTSNMRQEADDYFLNPPPGSAAARAVEFGIDLTLT